MEYDQTLELLKAASVQVSPNAQTQPQEHTIPQPASQEEPQIPAPIPEEEIVKEDVQTLAEIHEELKKDEISLGWDNSVQEKTQKETEEAIEWIKQNTDDMSWYNLVKDNEWFNSMIQQLTDIVNETKMSAEYEKKHKELIEKKYNETIEKYNELKTESKTKNYEANRFSLDDDDEYILSIKQKLKQNPTDEALRDKLRDLYLQQVGNFDWNFDPYETKRDLLSRRVQGVKAMSQWTKSSSTTIATQEEQTFQIPSIRMK